MGQQNARDSKLLRREVRVDTTPVVGDANHRGTSGGQKIGSRYATMRENILQQPAQYRDPMTEVTLTSSGGTAVRRDGTQAVGSTTTTTTTNAAAAAAPSAEALAKQKKYPVVLRYADKDAKQLLTKKQNVYVTVETLGWRPVQMAPSEDSFYAILELTPGSHRYRFLVQDKEVVDSTQAIAEPPNEGSKDPPANILQLNEVLLMTKEDEEIIDDGEGWGQNHEMFVETRNYPPIAPVHLRYTPLNTPPTAVRCTRDGFISSAGEIMSPENLPLPLNVTINHVYFQRREDHSVMGLTTRYCNKYTTVVYYSKMGSPNG
ncbi:hypothetical protein MOQ_009315 [Trypanosoma cruzi marinkellei]|uniref:Association with the SNF1 complex (ASC) domain-containing protein n=1 Tax=Trypanosoma cruzi marinkellei TaxID=85056 RepID=K2MMS2_TRYCR|nr:hypothetical protein MOQ_009315 [Trypanosoma cruzi marinkellei]